MPDAAMPEQVKITPHEILQFGSETKVGPTTTPETLARQKRLRDLKEKGASGRDRIEAARETGEGAFNSARALEMELGFGGGKAHETGTPPTAELDTSRNPDTAESSSFNTAKPMIEKLNTFIQYADILKEVQKGKSPAEVIRERVSRGETSISTVTEYQAARDKALDLIINTSTVQELFPEIFSSMTPAQRKEFMHDALANDPVLRNKVVRRMKDIADEVQKLPSVTSDEEYNKAKSDRAIAEPKLDAAKTNILNTIRADIHTTPPLTPAQEDQIKDWLDKGMAPESIMRSLSGLVINATNVPRFTELQAIVEKQRELTLTREKYYKTSKPADRAGFQNDINNLTNEINTLKGTTISDTDINDFHVLLTKYSPTKDAAGIFVSGLSQNISEASALGREIKASDDTIKRKESDSLKSERASRNARLAKEADLIDQLNNVMSDAIADTLEERYDKMALLEQKALSEDREKTTSEDDQKIISAKKENWIKYDPKTREKTSDKKKINEDLRMLAYEGEDGIKRLMIRELGFTFLDDHGNPIPGVNYENVDLTKLTDEQKKRLDAVYQKHGTSYRDKLFKDMFLARTLRSRLKDSFPGTNKMGLRKEEWELLGQNFSVNINEALAKSKEAQAAIKNLEAQGIKPDGKMRWILFILLGLFGATALAGFTAAGGGISAAAAGIKGAGSGAFSLGSALGNGAGTIA